MWVAMEAVTRENGSLSYLPGSHAGGVRPHADSLIKGFSQVYCATSLPRESASLMPSLSALAPIPHG